MGISSFAQNNFEGLPTSKLLKYAQSAKNMGDLHTYISCIEEYSKQKPNNNEQLYNLANAYFDTKNYSLAIKTYHQLFTNSSYKKWDITYKLGLSYKNTGNYKQAIDFFDKCIDERHNKDLVRLSKIHKSGCEIGLDTVYNYVEATIKNLGNEVNSAHIDFSPLALSENQLLYASIKTNNMVSYEANNPSSMTKSRFYLAEKT
jgi:tetratricopeptide (TPR) repeat protein